MWRIAAGAAHKLDTTTALYYRIIASDVNWPIMPKIQIGDAREASDRIVIAIGNRFVASIPAGHHKRPAPHGVRY
jgi:hypothetical protein